MDSSALASGREFRKYPAIAMVEINFITGIVEPDRSHLAKRLLEVMLQLDLPLPPPAML